MAVTRYAKSGTVGALTVITLVLVTQLVPLNLEPVTITLDGLPENSVYTNKSNVTQGEEFSLIFRPQMLSLDVGIQILVIDFHDSRGIYAIQRNPDGSIEDRLRHIYHDPGEYTISVLALRSGNISRIFTTVVTVRAEIKEVGISTNTVLANEDEPVFFTADILNANYSNFEDFVWDLGDGITKVGSEINHAYAQPGEYKVRLRAYTNDRLVHTAFTTIRVINEIPGVTIQSQSSALEDEQVEFSATMDESPSDLGTLDYIWSFGDNTYDRGATVTHAYSFAGTYKVTLTVIDDDGAVGSDERNFTVINENIRNAQILNPKLAYYEGETIISTAQVVDSISDIYSLDYDWDVDAMGKQIAVPHLDEGLFRHNVTITDDDGFSSFAESELLNVVNVNPVVSLIDAYTSFNVTISISGTVDTQLNFTLFNNDTIIDNASLTSDGVGWQSYTISNLVQPLYEYWDILYIVTNTTNDYQNFIRTEFKFDNAPTRVLSETCDGAKICSTNNWRQPISPLDLQFPVTLEFEYFDPSSDSLTLFVEFGDNVVQTPIASGFGGTGSYTDQFGTQWADQPDPSEITRGSVKVIGQMSGGQSARELNYYITDEDGGRSADSMIPLLDYSKIPPPDGYPNITSWARAGTFIKHFAPRGMIMDRGDFLENTQNRFSVEPFYYNPEALNYTWHMGDGTHYELRNPSHAYLYSGHYLVWVVISDGFYESVAFAWINVINNFHNYEPFFTALEIDHRLTTEMTTVTNEYCVERPDLNVSECYQVTELAQGLPMEGKSFKLSLEGINFDLIGTSNLEYLWDFGDGILGYGREVLHTYYEAGSYPITVSILDEHGSVESFKLKLDISNSAPVESIPIFEEYNIVEGQQLYIPAFLTDSDLDRVDIQYTWEINGINYMNSSLSLNLPTGFYPARVIANDSDGALYTHHFNVTVEEDPLELTLPKIYLYGNTETAIDVFGTLSPTIYSQESYRTSTEIRYRFLGKSGELLDSGTASYDFEDYSFNFNLNFSQVLTDIVIEKMNSQTISVSEYFDAPDIITGDYDLILEISDDARLINQLQTTINIVGDQDGDLINDEFEFLMTNTLDDFTFSMFDSDTDNNGVSDSVEFLLADDPDQDGLPSIYEMEIGSNTTNPDTDGDGLEDGWGNNGFGELVYGTNAAKADTDDDGIDDLVEVFGWEVEVWTRAGVSTYSVSADPTKFDTDNDGLSDYLERNFNVDPRKSDSDGDGLNDGFEYDNSLAIFWWDSDNDTISDGIEINGIESTWIDETGAVKNVISYPSALLADSDEDGLSDGLEINYYKSLPTSKDTDQDGILDPHELGNGTLIADADTDNDLLSDGVELRGFEIPFYTFTAGEYSDDETLLEPTYSNGTVWITTNPLNPDTDGDGLTDYEELMDNTAQGLSNPTLPDSDGDGILDRVDPYRLISDYAPPAAISNMDLYYFSGITKIVELVADILVAPLEFIWDLMSDVVGLIWGIISDIWEWREKEVCFIVCGDVSYPWIKSSSEIRTIVSREFRKFLTSSTANLERAFGTLSDAAKNAVKTFEFSGSLSVETNFFGFPTDISFDGDYKMFFSYTERFTRGFFSPRVEIRLTLQDDDMIDYIDVYKGAPGSVRFFERIDVNQRVYNFNEEYFLDYEGTLSYDTEFRLEIHDRAGNVKVLTKIVTGEDFVGGVLEQGVRKTLVILDKFAGWALDMVTEAAQLVVDAVIAVGEWAIEVLESVVSWVVDQFIEVWATFVRETLNAVLRSYQGEAEQVYSSLVSGLQGVTTQLEPIFSDITPETGIMDGLDNLFANFGEITSALGSTDDEDSILGVAKGLASILDLEFLRGTIFEDLIATVSDVVNKILGEAIQAVVNPIAEQVLSLLGFNFEEGLFDKLKSVGDFSVSDFNTGDISDQSNNNGFVGMLESLESTLIQFSQPSAIFGSAFNSIGGDTVLELIDFILENQGPGSIMANFKALAMPMIKIALLVEDLGGAFIEYFEDLYGEFFGLTYLELDITNYFDNMIYSQLILDQSAEDIFKWINPFLKFLFGAIGVIRGVQDVGKDLANDSLTLKNLQLDTYLGFTFWFIPKVLDAWLQPDDYTKSELHRHGKVVIGFLI